MNYLIRSHQSYSRAFALTRRASSALSRRAKLFVQSPKEASNLTAANSKNLARHVRRIMLASMGIKTQEPTENISADSTLFVPLFQLFARPGTYSESVYGWHGKGIELSHQNIAPNQPIRFTFHALEGGIIGIHLFIGTHNRVNDSNINIDVFSVTGDTKQHVLTSIHPTNELLNNQLNFFPFNKIIGESGGNYCVEITSPDSRFNNRIALWGTRVHPTQLRRPQSNVADCIDYYTHHTITTRYIEAPRKERFFPRYTASFSDNLVTENAIGWEGSCFQSMNVPIYPNSSAEICFQAPRECLSKIVLSMVTFSRENTGNIDFNLLRLCGDTWKKVYFDRLAAHLVSDNSPYEIEFPSITDSKGSWFKLTIESADSTPSNCIGVHGTVVCEELDSFNQLQRSGDLISMVDAEISNPNLVGLYKKTFPYWENLLTTKTKENFNLLVVTSKTDDFFQPRSRFALANKGMIITAHDISDLEIDFSGIDLIIFENTRYASGVEMLLEVSRRLCIPTCDINDEERAPIVSYHQSTLEEYLSKEPSKTSLKSRIDFSSYVDFHLYSDAATQEANSFVISNTPSRDEIYSIYQQIAPAYKKKRLPRISVVSILYRKETEIKTVLESLRRQNYPGEMEVLLVDDCSPDNSVACVEEKIRAHPSDFGPQGRIPIRIIKNQKNSGNCHSRNAALKEARSDVVLIIDADCVLNSHCLSAHAACHSIGDSDVVIGTHNLETNHKDPFSVLEQHDRNPQAAQEEAQLQDEIVLHSFLNSITRNVSIRRDFIRGELFDELFSYSANPESGFGWEDVEMGYRLFQQGARFRYTNLAVSVHLSHPSSCEESSKPARSIKNFRRLLQKHPDLRYVARRWVLDTFMKICAWMDNSGITANDDRDWVSDHLKAFDSLRPVRSQKQPLRIASYRWHCPHQYEIYKMPHNITLFSQNNQAYTSSWAYEQRPLRPNVKLKDISTFDNRDFDLVILHFDENILFPENSNGVLGRDWGESFKWLRENTNLPMIAICHGTPQFRGQYNPCYSGSDYGSVLEHERKLLVDYLGDIPVVCNSYQAQAEWRFKRSQVIWHGFDPAEFGPAPTGHGILTLAESMYERPLYRGAYLFDHVRKIMPNDIKFSFLKVPRPAFDYKSTGNNFACAKFRLYNQAIRKHSIYFNPTERSPMPRSRGEAMTSGLVSVSADNHDVSLFIKNGINGLYSNDPLELADYLTFLVRNESACKEMGKKSRALASDIFNIDRFHRDWRMFLEQLGF